MQLELATLRRDWIESQIPKVESFFRGKEFTSDDLHQVLDAPEQPNYFGVLMATMKRRHLVVEAGYIISSRPSRNAGRVLKWRLA